MIHHDTPLLAAGRFIACLRRIRCGARNDGGGEVLIRGLSAPLRSGLVVSGLLGRACCGRGCGSGGGEVLGYLLDFGPDSEEVCGADFFDVFL